MKWAWGCYQLYLRGKYEVSLGLASTMLGIRSVWLQGGCCRVSTKANRVYVVLIAIM